MKLKVVVLGAGFGGLELTTILSEAFPERLDLTLIDKNDSFVFGFSKLDVMFGRHASSKAILTAFEERGIKFICKRDVLSLDPNRKVVLLDDGQEIPYDLYLGIPTHCAPKVVVESGLTEDGWIPIDFNNLRTRFPGVYAIGDVTRAGVPKVGVFAESMGRVAAAAIIAEITQGPQPDAFAGKASCYIEFGVGKVGRIDIDFFSGPTPVGTFAEPSTALVAEKQHFGSSRRRRWFGQQ